MPSSSSTTTSAVGGPDDNGFGRGRTIFVLAVVVACFAILWPKVFYPMFTASINGHSDEACCDVISEKDTNAYHLMTEICLNIIHKEKSPLDSGQGQIKQPPSTQQQPKIQLSKPTVNLCRNEILKQCGVDVLLLLKENAAITKEYKKSMNQIRSFNTSHCLKISYGVDVAEIGLPRMTKGPFSSPSHMRPERPLRPEILHPALREKGQGIPSPRLPRRTIEKEARPGPVPGMRPPVAQAAHVPNSPKGSGTMGIVMPMYTIGIIVFFVYTLMKILFKKPSEETATPPVKPPPMLKDFVMESEYRKYVASEDYPNGSERSMKEEFNKKPSGSKSRFQEDPRRQIESESVSPQEDSHDDESTEFSNSQISSSSTEATTVISYRKYSSTAPPVLTIEPPTPSTPPVDTSVFNSGLENNDNAILSSTPTLEIEERLSDELMPLLENAYATTDYAKITPPTTITTSIDNPPTTSGDDEGLTSQQLTSAALFFDTTIEIPDGEYELVSKKLDASPKEEMERKSKRSTSPTLEIPPTITPPMELVDYALSLAQSILSDATSIVLNSNVASSQQQQLTLDLVESTNETNTVDNITNSTETENGTTHEEPVIVELLVPCKVEQSITKESTVQQTNLPISQEILKYAENLARQILTDTESTVFTHINSAQPKNEPSSSSTIQKPVDTFIHPDPIKVETDAVVEPQASTPLVTMKEDSRKNSEPILAHQKSRLEITPVEEGALVDNAVVIDTLGGYVTLADEGGRQGTRHKAFLKNLGCGVEITSFEDTVEQCHRVMSMDSNDSVVTVKELDDTHNELELEKVEGEIENSSRQEINAEIEIQELDTPKIESTHQSDLFIPSQIQEEDMTQMFETQAQLPPQSPLSPDTPTITNTDITTPGGMFLISNDDITNNATIPSQQIPITSTFINDSLIGPNLLVEENQQTKSTEPSEPQIDILEKVKHISASEKDDIKLIIEQVIDQAEQTVECQYEPSGETTPQEKENQESVPKLNQEIEQKEILQDVTVKATVNLVQEDKPDPSPILGFKQVEVGEMEKSAAKPSQIEERKSASSTTTIESTPQQTTSRATVPDPQQTTSPATVPDPQQTNILSELISQEQLNSIPTRMSSTFTLLLDEEHDPLEPKSIEERVNPLDLDFESIDDPDPEIKAMYSFLQSVKRDETIPSSGENKEMEIEFIPEVHPQSVPPVTLESCTNPLKSSIMMALTESLVEQSSTEPITVDGGQSEQSKDTNKSTLVELNAAPELTQNLPTAPVMLITTTTTTTTTPLENNRSAKLHEIAGDVTTDGQLQDVLLSKPMSSPKQAATGVDGGQVRKEKAECSRKELPGEEKETTGSRDRDAIVKAVQGILDALGEQTSKCETEALSEKLSKPESGSVSKQEKEVDLDLLKGSNKPEEKAAEIPKEPERKSSVKRHPSSEKEVKFQLPPKEEETEEEEEEEVEEEEEPVRPPTPPRLGSKKSKHHNHHLSHTENQHHSLPHDLILFAKELSENIIQQSAAAAIAAVKSASQQPPRGTPSPQGHREILSVLGIEETAEMESGEKWDDRTPTPTFRMATPPCPHRPPSPPEDIPSIFLDGPLPSAGQQLMVSDSMVEVEGGGEYIEGDDSENLNAPIILSGKVTLSVISGGGGAPDEITDASSLSYDDRAQAGKSKDKTAIKAEKGLSNARKGPALSHKEDYEAIKKAEADNDGQKEDTAGDISVMEGLDKHEELPKDEE